MTLINEPISDSSAEGRTGGEASPPPAIPGQAPSSSPDAGSRDTSSQERSAPAPESAASREDRIFDELMAGRTPEEIRRTNADRPAPPSANPSTDAPTGTDPSPGAVDHSQGSPSSQAGAPSNQQQPPQVPPEFGGLDQRSYQALRRTGTLPAAADWQDMPTLARANLVRMANATLRQRERDFQQQHRGQQQVQQQDPAASTAHLPSEGPTAAQGGQGTMFTGTAGAGQAQGPQTTPGADHLSGAEQRGLGQQQQQAPNHVQLALQRLKDDFGDQLATPIDQIQQALGQELSAKDQQIRAMAGQVQATNRQLLELRRDIALTRLEPDFPQLKDQRVREQVFRMAAHLVIARHSAGEPGFTLEQGLEQAARAELFPNLQEQQQRDLARQNRASVRGTSERSTAGGVDRPNRALTRQEREDQAFDQLASGRSPDEIRAAFR